MLILKDQTLCCGCGACATICPKNAITMTENQEGFRYPVVDPASCVECGLCQRACPILTSPKSSGDAPMVLGAVCKEDQIRAESSSGGVFSLLASHVLKQGGVVFGAALDEDLTVHHIPVEKEADLFRLRGSKYVQSHVANTYRQVKDYLKQGRLVLYTGTPCQIGGLRAYLGKDDPNLICQDLICHGAPSPAVWKEYIQYRQKQAGSKATRVSFRDKSQGWRQFCMHFDFENGSTYKMPFPQDPYMKAFLADLSLRPSCYACSFKGETRVADITLADFWGVQDIHPDRYDDKGTSLIFLNTQKGKALFDAIADQVTSFPANKEAAISWNSAMIRSVKKPQQRESFMESIFQEDFEAVTQRHLPKNSLLKKIKNKVKNGLKKLLCKS